MVVVKDSKELKEAISNDKKQIEIQNEKLGKLVVKLKLLPASVFGGALGIGIVATFGLPWLTAGAVVVVTLIGNDVLKFITILNITAAKKIYYGYSYKKDESSGSLVLSAKY